MKIWLLITKNFEKNYFWFNNEDEKDINSIIKKIVKIIKSKIRDLILFLIFVNKN